MDRITALTSHAVEAILFIPQWRQNASTLNAVLSRTGNVVHRKEPILPRRIAWPQSRSSDQKSDS
jgi:hypothetical protein